MYFPWGNNMLKDMQKKTEGNNTSFPHPFVLPEKNKEKPLPKESFKTAERNLKGEEDITFFDHMRVKNLGGEINTIQSSPGYPKIPLPSFLLEKDSPKNSQYDGNEHKQHFLQAEPKIDFPLNNKKQDTKKQDNKKLEGSIKSLPHKKIESGLILSIKWIIKLLLSLVFLIWIFILGVLVGRGSIQHNPQLAPKNVTPMLNLSQSAFSSGSYDEILSIPEPVTREYPVSQPPEENAPNGNNFTFIPINQETNYKPDKSVPVNNASTSEDYPPSVKEAPQLSHYPPKDNNPNSDVNFGYVIYASNDNNLSQQSLTPIVEKKSPKTTENTSTRTPNTSTTNTSISNNTSVSTDPGYWPKAPQGTGTFTVQIASPTNENEAKSTVEKYRKKGFDAYYYPSTTGSRFPTRVGRYNTKEEAEVAKIKLEKEGAVGPYVSKLN
jgi:cell division septation protein DedD